eukprot:264456-Chlamydomonas_euryale.AAC.5
MQAACPVKLFLRNPAVPSCSPLEVRGSLPSKHASVMIFLAMVIRQYSVLRLGGCAWGQTCTRKAPGRPFIRHRGCLRHACVSARWRRCCVPGASSERLRLLPSGSDWPRGAGACAPSRCCELLLGRRRRGDTSRLLVYSLRYAVDQVPARGSRQHAAAPHPFRTCAVAFPWMPLCCHAECDGLPTCVGTTVARQTRRESSATAVYSVPGRSSVCRSRGGAGTRLARRRVDAKQARADPPALGVREKKRNNCRRCSEGVGCSHSESVVLGACFPHLPGRLPRAVDAALVIAVAARCPRRAFDGPGGRHATLRARAAPLARPCRGSSMEPMEVSPSPPSAAATEVPRSALPHTAGTLATLTTTTAAAATAAAADAGAAAAAAASGQAAMAAASAPADFLCPIGMSLMSDPVLLVETGHSYDRQAICAWLQRGNRTCPKTNRRLKSLLVAVGWRKRERRERDGKIGPGGAAAGQPGRWRACVHRPAPRRPMPLWTCTRALEAAPGGKMRDFW